jgi:hypothetical protein
LQENQEAVMELDLGQWIIISICAVLIGGYIYGYYYNRRKAENISVWLKAGLEKWGKVSAGKPLGGLSSGGRLYADQTAEPFQRIEAIFLLEPRENLIFWLFHRLQGRRDELVLKISLRAAPEQEVEAARRGDREFASRLAKASKKPFKKADSPQGFEMAYRSGKGTRAVESIRAFLEQYDRAIFRLTLRRESPHLFLRTYLPLIQAESAEKFFSALSDLGR